MDEHITVTELKKRGWTDTIIRDYLGEPDRYETNYRYRSAAPIRLYHRERAEIVERSDIWPLLMKKAIHRKAAATRAVETKRQVMLDHLDEVVINVPLLPPDVLIACACQHYNTRQIDMGDLDGQKATPDSSPLFIDRITVNYLRHVLSEYDKQLEEVFGKVGIAEAYREINRKVYAAIRDAYPTLASECWRQQSQKSAV